MDGRIIPSYDSRQGGSHSSMASYSNSESVASDSSEEKSVKKTKKNKRVTPAN